MKVCLKNILDFPSVNSKNPKKMNSYVIGDIPIYGSSKTGAPIGYIDKIDKIKYFEHCISWNRNGSVGYVFYRDHCFTTTEDHRVAVLKKEIKNISYFYIKYAMQSEIRNLNYSWNDKAGKEKVEKIEIDIPIDDEGNYDIKKQLQIVNKYKYAEQMKNEIRNIAIELENTEIEIEANLCLNYMCKLESIALIFDTEKGKGKYTKDYIKNNKGDYSIFSSQTSNEGEIGKINSFDYECNCLTWTTDGIYAGTVFLRENIKFSMTTHCGALILKKELNNSIYLPYFYYILNQELKKYAISDLNKRVTVDIIKNIKINIPIDSKGNYCVTTQKTIAKKYQEKIEKTKQINELKKLVVENITKTIKQEISI